jgi:hypothetical protein
MSPRQKAKMAGPKVFSEPKRVFEARWELFCKEKRRKYEIRS